MGPAAEAGARRERLERCLLGALVALRLVVIAGLDLGVDIAPTRAAAEIPATIRLVASLAFLATFVGVAAWRFRRSRCRGDLGAALALVLALGARLGMMAATGLDARGLFVYLTLKAVWPAAEAAAWMALVLAPFVAGSARARAPGLLCLAVVAMDIGWHTLAHGVLDGAVVLDSLVWLVREMAVVGLLVTGLSRGAADPPREAHSTRLTIGALVGTASLALVPDAARWMGAPIALLTGIAAIGASLAWAFAVRLGVGVDRLRTSLAMVTTSIALGVVGWSGTHGDSPFTSAEAELTAGAGSLGRACFDAAIAFGAAVAALRVGARAKRVGRLVLALALCGILALAATHLARPLIALVVLGTFVIAALGLRSGSPMRGGS